jgi:hypothetical protein
MKTLEVNTADYQKAAAMYGRIMKSNFTELFNIVENSSLNEAIVLLNVLINMQAHHVNFKRAMAIKLLKPTIVEELNKLQ